MNQYQKQLLKYSLDELDYFLDEIPEYNLEIIDEDDCVSLILAQGESTILKIDMAKPDLEDLEHFTSCILVGEDIENKLDMLGRFDLPLDALRYRDSYGEIRYHYFLDESSNDQLDWTYNYQEIDLSGNFVLSGEFVEISRGKIASLIEKKRGRVMGAVSMKTDYLVVGSNNSKKWKFQSYGTKINSALKINESNGKKVRFIQEKMLVALLVNMGLIQA